MKEKTRFLPIIAILMYFVMLTINVLGNALPINGRSTGQISDIYSNLFAPAGITFSIWGVIYLLLFIFSMNQFFTYNKFSENRYRLYNKINVFYIISSVANAMWIFAWHYDKIGLSVVLMLILLACLIRINLILRNSRFSSVEKLMTKLPFTVYFGWITVATIANITTFLVAIQWNRFSISDIVWTDIILLVGALIGLASILYYRSIAYGLVLVWAYSGIMLKHVSPEELDGQYISIVVTTAVSLIIIVTGIVMLIKSKKFIR